MVELCLWLLLNMVISMWNAYACGRSWVEAKTVGGWYRFMTWVGAVMSACGFTWCYVIVLAFGAQAAGFLNERWLLVALQTAYVVLIPVVLFATYAIFIDSWAQAFRRGGLLNYTGALYNTYAAYHNTMSAVTSFEDAVGNVVEAFMSGSDDDGEKGGALAVVVLIVVMALALGVLTTTAIICKVAASDRLLTRDEMEANRANAKK